ncbi:hypothetical protein F972_02996 [Acinetobacter sp. CIP 102529]|uniref:hypothetical protein n=1 Tax=Acinetobacter sp. CIP 102529 TaxID=1144668 RepID=UPI0002D0B7F7|nr:hypothetical protein [Acinetobacter sp. CIP 102529]ENU87730.1 hypothetical protein F972_02996 [Acinetobacter sp. CIP 102529]
MKFKFVLPVLICSTLLIGCKNQQEVEVEAKDKGVEELNNIENRWVDTYDLASSTSRIALATPVSQLQEVKRDLLTTEVSECLKPAKEALSSYMNMHIKNFLNFMADQEISNSISSLKLVEYFAIKTNCAGETNSNLYLVTEAAAEVVINKRAALALAEAKAKAKAEPEAIAKAEAELDVAITALAEAATAATN